MYNTTLGYLPGMYLQGKFPQCYSCNPKTKAEVISTANQSRRKYFQGPMRTQNDKQPKARGNTGDQVVIGC